MNNYQRRIFRWIRALLITAFVVQPVQIALPARAAVPSNPQQEDNLFVPFVSAGLSSDIVINSPKAESLVAGTFVFSAQPEYSGGILSVDFFAGNTLLGSDDSAANGYSIALDSSDLPDGQVTLRAVAHGTRDASAQVVVTNVRNPSQQTTATDSGAAVAVSEIGSAVMVPPGGLPAGATMSVDEKSEQEISSEFGIQWDELGVTFLGAQQVDTSAPMQMQPAVSSAGFAQRVQDGQAVVNYNIGPDADGDGVAEIIVVNTARVAGSNVVSDPLPEVSVGEASVAGVSQGMAYAAQVGLHGPPGSLIEFDVTGFNQYSPLGNVARFTSAVDGKEYESPAIVMQDDNNPGRQLFSTQIPLLPAGAATMIMVNLTTMDTSDPIQITVDAAPVLDRPAAAIVDEYLAATINYVNLAALDFPHLTNEFTEMAAAYTKLRGEVQTLAGDSSPAAQQYLNDLATLVLGSGILEQLAAPEMSAGPFSVHPAAAGPNATTQGCIKPNNRFQLRMANVFLGGATLLGCGLAFTGVGLAVCLAGVTAFFAAAEVAQDTIPDCPKPPEPPCPPGGGGGGTTGMGAAPPPGGNLCGGGGGGGGNGGNGGSTNPLVYTAAAATGVLEQELGRIKVFVVSDGQRTPFTGSTDRGGYFFLPFVPEAKLFTAYAIDTATGQVRSQTGIGPKTGESLAMWFDFGSGENAALENRWTGAGDGVNWTDGQNWSLGRVPGPVDTVVIDVESNPTIDFRGSAVVNNLVNAETLMISSGSLRIVTASSMSGKLVVNGGELVINTSLALNGPLEWTGGEISGEGKLSINGGATVSGTSPKSLQSLTIDNSSHFILSGTGDILGGVGVKFNNLSGAIFEFADTAGFRGYYYGGLGTTVNNNGTIRKSGTGGATLEAFLNNANSVFEVQAGSLDLRRGGSIAGGTATVAGGAFLNFASETYTMTGTFTGNGEGQARGTGAYFTSSSNATLNFPNGGFGLTAGGFDDGGTFNLQGKFLLSGTTHKNISKVTLNNEGLFRLEGDYNILGGQGMIFNNLAGATFEYASDVGYQGFYYGGLGTTFNNSGTVIKSGGSGVSVLEVVFNNQGAAVNVNTGTLQLRRGGNIAGGTFTALSGAFLDFASETYTMTASLSGNGEGQVRGTGAYFASSSTATLNFPNGGFGLVAGGFDDGGTFTLQGKFLLSGTTSKQISKVTINNEGLFRIDGIYNIFGGQGVTFNNKAGATFEFASDADYNGFYFGGGGTTFNNSGTVIKSGGSDVSELWAVFNNQGAAVSVNTGTLQLRQGGALAGGTYTALGGAFLDFVFGDFLVSDTLTGAGAGVVRGTGATIASATTATLNFTGGGFGLTDGELEGPGSMTFQGLVTLSGGGKSITGVTINNTGTWVWIGPGNIFGGTAAVFNNSGTFDARTEGSAITYNGNYFGGGNTTFNNTGSVIKSGDGNTATLQLCYNGTDPGVGITLQDACP